MKTLHLPGIAIILAILGATQALGNSIDFAANFNAPNNPGANAGFSYGQGTSPAGFSALTATSQDTSCIGTSSYCWFTGQQFPNDPSAIWNGTGSEVVSGTVDFQPGLVHLDPQGLGVIVRYTAALSGSYTVHAVFKGQDFHGNSTVFISAFANGVQQGSTTSIATYTDTHTYDFTANLNAGQTLDFIESAPGASYDGTGLSGTITTPDVSETPEPASLSLILLAIPGLAAARRLRK